MKSAKIFLVGDDEDKLTPMVETPYDKEDILQVLLARYPDLLPGDQITPENPRRWLLVKREMEVPGEEGEGGRFSLDHLFLDQDGIPTFVECKRASDTRTRREVVAQMLDYAANGTEYWSIDQVRQAAAETASGKGKSLDAEIAELLRDKKEIDIEGYWTQVEENLRNGKVRLIFVTDETPKELRRLVEFLNEKMIDVVVLAVEIKQFLAEGKKALVPRVIGLTESAREDRKRPISRDELLSRCTPSVAEVFQRILDLAMKRKDRIYWGKIGFSVGVYLTKQAQHASFAYCFPPATFQFYFPNLPLTNEEQDALYEALMNFGIFTPTATRKTLTAALEGETVNRMQEVYDFILGEVDKIARGQE